MEIVKVGRPLAALEIRSRTVALASLHNMHLGYIRHTACLHGFQLGYEQGYGIGNASGHANWRADLFFEPCPTTKCHCLSSGESSARLTL
jgi:hypothetical protein